MLLPPISNPILVIIFLVDVVWVQSEQPSLIRLQNLSLINIISVAVELRSWSLGELHGCILTYDLKHNISPSSLILSCFPRSIVKLRTLFNCSDELPERDADLMKKLCSIKGHKLYSINQCNCSIKPVIAKFCAARELLVSNEKIINFFKQHFL